MNHDNKVGTNPKHKSYTTKLAYFITKAQFQVGF